MVKDPLPNHVRTADRRMFHCAGKLRTLPPRGGDTFTVVLTTLSFISNPNGLCGTVGFPTPSCHDITEDIRKISLPTKEADGRRHGAPDRVAACN